MNSQKQAIENLCIAIEHAVDRKIKTPRDFDFLSEAIFKKLHQTVSPSTLKRVWGYLPSYSTTRISTLDILAQFIDYKDWNDFFQTTQTTDNKELADNPTDTIITETKWYRKPLFIGSFIIVLLVIGGIFLFGNHTATNANFIERTDTNSTSYILKCGQTFETSSDYLRLFGITSQERFWDKPLPHHDGIIIWGPEYQHPEWHNEGDRDSLFPTITEWWEPADSLIDTKERGLLMSERNEQLYFYTKRSNELRITFMKNVKDSGYVFLGVYRTDIKRSDSSHVVWERIADQCDLTNLDYLQQLRH